VTIQMRVTEQYFPLGLSIKLCMLIITSESENKILKCDHSNDAMDQYFFVVTAAIYYASQSISIFSVC